MDSYLANLPVVGFRFPNLTTLPTLLQRRDELLLSEHFSEGVRRVRKSLPGAPLKVINFDWHGMMKDLREHATVEGLWALLESICPKVTPPPSLKLYCGPFDSFRLSFDGTTITCGHGTRQ